MRQPEVLVASFVMRGKEKGHRKYILNSEYEYKSVNVHHGSFVDAELEKDGSKFVYLDEEYFILNHYNCQSYEYWCGTKCTRGDSDHYKKLTPDDFFDYDENEVKDTRLMEQNKGIGGVRH
jgi:hypothetical protein